MKADGKIWQERKDTLGRIITFNPTKQEKKKGKNREGKKQGRKKERKKEIYFNNIKREVKLNPKGIKKKKPLIFL